MPTRDLTRSKQSDQTDYNRRAERVVEVEDQLRDAREQDAEDGTADKEVTINLASSHQTVDAPVVGVERAGDSCAITVLLDGQEQTYSLQWPKDTTDSEEPLVRLAEHCGVTPSRIGDIDTVSLIEVDGTHTLYIPPAKHETLVNIRLPGDRTPSFTRVPFRDRLHRTMASISKHLLLTPLIGVINEGTTFSPSYRFNVNKRLFIIFLGLVLAGLPFLYILQHMTMMEILMNLPTVLMGTLVLAFMLGLVVIPVAIFTAIEIESGVDADFVSPDE